MSTTTYTGVRIVDMPDLGAVTDASSVVGELAGSGRFGAQAMRSYVQAYTYPGSGAVTRSATSRMADFASVKDFGARGDGATDDTAAIQTAINAVLSGSSIACGKLYFPPGDYLVTATLTATGSTKSLTLEGAGRGVSRILANMPTGDILSLALGSHLVNDLGIWCTAVRTAGAHINSASNIAMVERVELQNFAIAINGADAMGAFRSVVLNAPIANAAGIVINGYAAGCVIDNLVGYVGSATPQTWVEILASGATQIINSDLIKAQTGLTIAPAAGAMVMSTFVANCYFDTNTQNGVAISPNGGTVSWTAFSNCWMCSNGANGVMIDNLGAGPVASIALDNCIASNNINGSGVVCVQGAGALPTDLRINGGLYAGNKIGIALGTNQSLFSIMGATIGMAGVAATGVFGGNSQAGISLPNGCDNFTISNNLISGNGTNIAAGTLPGGSATPVSWRIKDNDGFVTYNSGVFGTTAGPTSFTIAHGLSFTPRIQEINVTPNSGLPAGTVYWVANATAANFTLAFNPAPGAGVLMLWQARAAGA